MDNKQESHAGKDVSGMEQVLLDDGIQPFVGNIISNEFHLRLFTVKETKFTKKKIENDHKIIFLSKIISIQHVQNTKKKYMKETIKQIQFELKDAHFTRIFLWDNKPTGSEHDKMIFLDLITCGFSRLHVHIASLWHAQRLRAALCIDDKYGHSDVYLAESYYRETLASFRELESNKSPLADQIELLHEFADEVVSDVELKMICFNSKDLFMILFKLYENVLSPPDLKMIHMKNKALIMTNISSKKKADMEIEEVIFKKLLLFHAVLRVSFTHAVLLS